MKRIALTYFWVLAFLFSCSVGGKKDTLSVAWEMKPAKGVACDTVSIDTLEIYNPFVTYERSADKYYMTGDGGHLWVSENLRIWTGPYDVLRYDTASWVGAEPVITSPEIHKYKGKYYFMATFGTAGANGPKRSCTALVSESMTGPYVTVDAGSRLLDEREMAAHPTFCTDELGAGYMIYNHLGEQNGDGTVQIVRFTDDLGRRMGEAYVMFSASEVPWNGSEREGKKVFSPVMESPFLFYSGEESMGILFTAMKDGKRAVGVAYSETVTLNGPWVVEENPLLENAYGATMFKDYDGTLVMVVCKDTLIGGVERCVPRLVKTDSQFEKLQIKGNYKF